VHTKSTSKSHKIGKITYSPTIGDVTPTFEPKTLESQSKVQKNRILALFLETT